MNLLKFLFVLFFLLLVGLIYSENQSYQMAVTKSGVNAIVLLNGYPFFEIGDKDTSMANNINYLIIKGMNTITIHVEKISDDAKFPSFSLRLYVYPDGAKSTSEFKEVYKFEWDSFKSENKDADTGNPIYPKDQKYEFTIDTPPPSNFFNEGQKITLNDDTKEKAFNLIKEFYNSIAKNDMDKFFKLQEYKINDVYSSMYMTDIKSKMESSKKYLTDLIKKPEFKLEPVKKEDLIYKLYCNDKLLWIKTKDKKAPIQTSSFEIEMIFGLINNELKLVR